MKVMQVGEGAWFVPSYSEQTLAPAYNTAATVQTFSGAVVVTDRPLKDDDLEQVERDGAL